MGDVLNFRKLPDLAGHSAVEGLAQHFEELRLSGEGYLEAGLQGDDFPYLTLGFRGDHAIVHRFDESGGSCLHVGDGTVAPDAEVEVVIMEEPAVFTGDVVLSTAHAWAVISGFVRNGQFGEPNEWIAL